ncbi:AAA family ATPase [Lentzea terrae]|uniref:AAA family ATPase n=1 Tax=Lentzea terrae TaxID=2200761 RepID=UPI001E4B93E6|nr:ATP-binding protein [Lentzea terrae]
MPPPRDCPSALPYDLAGFTGRSTEVAHCRRPATTESIIAIDGMAGSGKSAFAVRLAHLLADRFPDGQFFVDLHGHTPGHDPLSANAALADLLRCHGLPGPDLPEDLTHRIALWRSRLKGRRTLIVIDNAVDAAQVAPLVPGSPAGTS